jgi:hypothetical protein
MISAGYFGSSKLREIPKFGATLEEIHQYFVAEQERMHQQLSGTSLMYREMDADGDFNSNVEEAYEFWLS